MSATTPKTESKTGPKKGLMGKLRNRLGRRGVAMVEGAIIFPLMGGMLILLELGHHSYDAYITVGHVAEERTWTSATTGSWRGACPPGHDDTSYADQVGSTGKYFTLTTGPAGGDPQVGPSNTPPSKSVSAGLGTGTASVPSGLPGENGFWKHSGGAGAKVSVTRGGRTFTNSPQSSDTVYCNQAFYGTLVQIIKSAASKL